MNCDLVVLRDPEELRRYADEARREALVAGGELRAAVGLVPTMGALHDGHLQLMRRASELARQVVATIFVNPTQFGPSEDFSRYPRDLDGDLLKCREAGVSAVFAPEAGAMYPSSEQTRVTIGALGEELCGATRPGHFTGVCTIVSKLFAIAGPCTAVFGLKDYQQFKIIERMTRDLFLPITVVGYPTVRESDGLAMSSRNRTLSATWREAAASIPRALDAVERVFAAGERSPEKLQSTCGRALSEAGLVLDYVQVADSEELTLFSAPIPDEQQERVLVALAVFAGSTRLIDNRLLRPSTQAEGRA
ncbi:MAG: hypothetical protein RJA70_1200 [Pseudomonadota bacterium]|jgi:pantoate--beta-alanine ligase